MAKNYKHFLLTPLTHPLGLAGLSGLILALAYPGWSANWLIDAGLLVWLGFIPLIFALGKIQSGTGQLKRFFGLGFSAGIVYFLIIFRWFWSFYPLDTLGIKNGLASFAILLPIYLLTSAAMAAFWGLFSLILGYLKQKVPKQMTTWGWLTGPAIFIFLEYARTAGYGLVWLGSGTLLGPHWTMGNLAYALAANPAILRLSSYIGIYGITFLVLAVNFLIFKATENSGKKIVKIVSALVLVLIATFGIRFLYKNIPADDVTAKKVNFAIIQTNIPTKISPNPKENLDAFKEQLALLNSIAKNHPESQIIIFPETSDFFKNIANLLSSAQAKAYFNNLFKDPRLIISGVRTIDPNGVPYSRVFSLDTKKDVIGYYDKQLLTPGGEFLPYTIKLTANFLSKIKVSQIEDVRDFKTGKNGVSTVNFEGLFNVSPIICSELLSPNLARSITQNSDIVAGMASYGIFHGKDVFARQNRVNVQFRAAENNKPILMAANRGRSYAVNNRGIIQAMAPNQSPQILTGSIALQPRKSWYNKVGDLPIFFVSFLFIILGFRLQVSGYREKVKFWLRSDQK